MFKGLNGIFLFLTFIITSCEEINSTNNSSNSTSNDTLASLYLRFNNINSEWVIFSGILVMIMTPAIGFFYGGLVKSKNMLSMIGQSFAIYTVSSISWTLIGYSMVYGKDTNQGLIGTVDFSIIESSEFVSVSLYNSSIPVGVFYFFQMQFACIAPSIIIGAVAERVRFLPMIIFTFIWHLIVYCPIAHWNWNTQGWLYLLGTKDYAGGNVVHISAGITALSIVLFLEKESVQQFRQKKKAKYTKIDTHLYVNLSGTKNSLIFLVIGTMLLWFGWFGFNGGSARSLNSKAGIAIINTTISPSTSLLTWVALDSIIKGRPTVSGMCIAIVCGLVGITPSAGYVQLWAGGIIGIVSAIFPYLWCRLRDRYKIFDDRLDVFGCHAISAIVGGILTGIFYCDSMYNNQCTTTSPLGVLYGRSGMLLLYQLIGIAACVGYAFVISFMIIYLISLLMKISVSDDDESGVDMIDFGENALPTAEVYLKKFEEKIQNRKIPINESYTFVKYNWFI